MIYLDHAATSFPKPERVLRAMEDFVRVSGANPGRGGHRRAREAELMIDETRVLIARLTGCSSPERVVFTLNATDALNMAIKGVLAPGDHVITSVLEHNSVSRPLNRLAENKVITLTRLDAGADHIIDPDAVAKAFTSATRLVALSHVSNVTGTIQRIADIGRIVRDRGALFLVDAAQSAGIVPINMEASSIDLLAFTGHKGLLGPTGTGGLIIGSRADVRPWREGGTGGDSKDPFQPLMFPYVLEGGTPNVFGLAGLREGVRILLERGIENVLAHKQRLLTVFYQSLKQPASYHWYGADVAITQRGDRGLAGLVGLTVEGFLPAELAAILDAEFDIAVRAGLHCAPYAHRHQGSFPDGTVRFSFGLQTSDGEARAAAEALDQISLSI